MLTSFIRTLILYLIVIAALRIMGKRQLGELQPSELVVAIMISDLASIPISDRSLPLWEGIIPIAALAGVELIFSVLVIKSEFFRTVITGRPAVIVRDGVILFNSLRRLRLSIDDLLEQLRLMGYSDISEVDTVVLETNGQISVIPKEISRPVTCEDLKLSPTQTHLPHTVIADGKIRKSGIKAAGISEGEVLQILRRRGIYSPEKVFYMNITDDKKVFIQDRRDKRH